MGRIGGTYSMDVMTPLFLSITRFCTRICLISGDSEPYCSSNSVDKCAGNSAVSFG